jgi:hypothetical protein
MYRAGISFTMVLPGLLAAILFIPFVLNFLAHAWFGEKQFAPLVMTKLPVDSSVVTLPKEVKQFEPFEIALQLDTGKLAQHINDLVAKSSTGVPLQGINNKVFPEMRAEMAGDALYIDPPGPQAQLFSNRGETNWSWRITSEAPGRHKLLLKLHLQTADTSQKHQQVVDLAEIQIFAQKNLAEWMRRYGIWYIVITLLATGWWWRNRRAKKQAT